MIACSEESFSRSEGVDKILGSIMSRVSSQFLCVLVALLVCLSLLAKEIPSGKPERQGFSSERLNKITEHMNAKVEDGTMAGGMGLIARNGKVCLLYTSEAADE